MKAVVYRRYGSPEELKLEEVEKPIPKSHEVLVKVHAASINSWDADLLTGIPRIYRLMFGLFRPKNKIIGCDIAGTVEAVGSDAREYVAGDEVLADISGHGFGGFAEYACVPKKQLVRKPVAMRFSEAAAIPQAAVLAFQGFEFCGGVNSGQRVLINGAGGGVGTFAIQMAKMYGAKVTAVDLPEKRDLMLKLGADEVLGYPETDFTKADQQYDFVMDVVSRHKASDYKRILKPGGACGIVGGKVSSLLNAAIFGSMQRQFKIGLVVHKPGAIALGKVVDLIHSGQVKPVIDREFKLADTADAMRYFMTGKVRGKVIIRVL